MLHITLESGFSPQLVRFASPYGLPAGSLSELRFGYRHRTFSYLHEKGKKGLLSYLHLLYLLMVNQTFQHFVDHVEVVVVGGELLLDVDEVGGH